MVTTVPKAMSHFTLAVLVLPAHATCLEAKWHCYLLNHISVLMAVRRQSCTSVLMWVHFVAAKQMPSGSTSLVRKRGSSNVDHI